jgi:pimeloyl-ACP methyl ester carboxylesterase
MFSAKTRRKLGIGAGALLLCLLLWNPVARAILAVRMALSLQELASGASAQSLPIAEASAQRQFQGQEYEALIYLPTNASATKAIILVAGLSELGCRHPRLIALARVLAEKGLMVVTPDIREFRQLQISAEPMNQILYWYKQIPYLEGGAKVHTTGLAGISFSGTLALMTAARPEIRDNVGFVVAIGPYSDLMRCTRDWFAAGPEFTAREYYPTRFYAKWIVMVAALEMIRDSSDRLFLGRVLNSLLLQQKIPPASSDLSAEGMRWYGLATMHEDQPNPELAQEIESYLISRIYPQLDPAAALKKIRCPVFLVHGAYDDLISSQESFELHGKIRNSSLLISPFLTHTHPTDTPLSSAQKFRAVLDTLFFCYKLAGVIR